MSSKRLGQLLISQSVISEEQLEAALELQREEGERYLGEILIEMGASQSRVNRVLDLYNKRKSLEDMLVSAGYVTETQLSYAREEHLKTRKPFREILLDNNLITEEGYLQILSRHFNLPIISLYNVGPDANLRKVVSEEYSKRNRVAVFEEDAKNIKVAVAEADTLLMEDLQRQRPSNKEIEFFLAPPGEIDLFIRNLYNLGSDSDVSVREGLISQEDQPSKSPRGVQRTLKIMDYIFNTALKFEASDIHLEAREKGGVVKLRVDGTLRTIPMPEDFNREFVSVISRIKILTRSMKIDEKVVPQDGSFRGRYKIGSRSKLVDFRISTVNSSNGECVTIRVLDQDKGKVTLEQLGFSGPVYDKFRKLIMQPEGMILVSGPTGSGKSTTLYAALNSVADPGKKIITAEDPIEYTYENIVQTQLNRARHVDFSSLLRAFLRQDPDVIMVGEIRDPETANMAIKAVQTGHLLLSTLHTVNTTKSVGRIRELQVEPMIFLSYTTAIMGQRLVRIVCPDCAEEYIPAERLLRGCFGRDDVNVKLVKGRGCKKCDDTGYRGRMAVTELWAPTVEELEQVEDLNDQTVLRSNAVAHGMRPMILDGLDKVFRQQTTLEELARVVPTIEADVELCQDQVSELLEKNS
jgi:type IV pilus assembly protein PilB